MDHGAMIETPVYRDDDEVRLKLETDGEEFRVRAELLLQWANLTDQSVVEVQGRNVDFRAMLRAVGTTPVI